MKLIICKRKLPEMVNLIKIYEPPKEFARLRAGAPAPRFPTGSADFPASRDGCAGPANDPGACAEKRKIHRFPMPGRAIFPVLGPHPWKEVAARTPRRPVAGWPQLSRVCAGLVAVVPQSAGQKVCRAVGASPAPTVLSALARAANHSCARRLVAAGHSRRADALSRQTEADEQKRARLAAALRENLKRRKAQARARRTSEAEATDEMPPAQAETSRS